METRRENGNQPIDLNDMVRYEVRVEGRVQGVNYRSFVQTSARTLGVSGWVRNARDGSVEVIAEGTPETLDEFVQQVRKGPALARVTDVQVDRKDAEGAPDPFEVR
jgi:acylphosphatase